MQCKKIWLDGGYLTLCYPLICCYEYVPKPSDFSFPLAFHLILLTINPFQQLTNNAYKLPNKSQIQQHHHHTFSTMGLFCSQKLPPSDSHNYRCPLVNDRAGSNYPSYYFGGPVYGSRYGPTQGSSYPISGFGSQYGSGYDSPYGPEYEDEPDLSSGSRFDSSSDISSSSESSSGSSSGSSSSSVSSSGSGSSSSSSGSSRSRSRSRSKQGSRRAEKPAKKSISEPRGSPKSQSTT